MQSRNRHVLTATVLAGAVCAAVVASRPPAENGAKGEPNPAAMRIAYRPGGYFPDGFPLHGKVKLVTAPVVEMGQRTRVRIEYTVGDMPVTTGTTLHIWKHFTSDVESFQVADPKAPAYFSAEFTSPNVRGKTTGYTNWTQRDKVSVFPYRKAAAVTIEQGSLASGDKVYFDLGGPKGFRMQHYEENLFNFRVVITRDEKVLGYAGDAAIKITGGPLRRLRVQAPSIVKPGEPFPVEILPQDEWGSLSRNATGLAFRVTSAGVDKLDFQYDPELLHYVARQASARQEGIVRIAVRTSDGKVKGLSNPIWVQRDPIRRVWYGDLHQHTYLADGRGRFEELYLYGRRVGLLDFGAVTEHHMSLNSSGPQFTREGRQTLDSNWPALMKATKLMNGWKGFTSILGYEYSVGTNSGGHHNVYYNADEAKTSMQLDPEDLQAPVGKMLKTLQLARVPTLVIPHIGGGPPDWSHPTDPRIERLFEVCSVHGVFEESFQKHLEAGQRLAASASGDTHTTSMGNAYPGLIYVNTNGLTGVYSPGKSRQELWDGLYQRRTFAVSGNTRILMDFQVDGEPMGGELTRNTRQARLSAKVSGTAALLRVDLLKNNRVIHTVHPARSDGRFLRVVWGDNLYQRRAAVGMTAGEMKPTSGRIRLVEPVHLDQAFEEVRQAGDGISWNTAAVSGDRDGFLADISGLTGDLVFRLDDSSSMGVFEVRVSLAQLKNEGYFAWSKPGKTSHPYMKQMGIQPALFLECEMVNPAATMDLEFTYDDREPIKPGDFWYLRMEQLDTNKAWSSPVWAN